ncbi:MAG: T9SS type A sorting domain-containing protein [Bacteroidetes bacterium]|nr:T9SS type A sorting domain-containing protein [Bacteroidota bacterium]
MRHLIFLIIISFLLIATGCSKTKTEYWANGNKKSELKYSNSKMNGLCKWWYEGGIMQMECNYKDDKLEGRSVRWNSNGSKQREDNYSNNLLNGKSIIFYENGVKLSEQNFKNDTLDGLTKEWFKNGHIKISGAYKKGYFDGKWIYTDINGLKAGEGNFINGTGDQTGFYPNGRISRIIHYEKNKKNGLEIWLNISGDTVKKIVYDLPKPSPLSLRVFDVVGRKVAILNSGVVDAGTHREVFDAGNLASGIYFVKIEAGMLTQTRKLFQKENMI